MPRCAPRTIGRIITSSGTRSSPAWSGRRRARPGEPRRSWRGASCPSTPSWPVSPECASSRILTRAIELSFPLQRMRGTMKWTCAFFLLLAACTSARPAPTKEGDLEARRKQLAGLISEQWEYTLRTSPEFASILGDLRYNDRPSAVTEQAGFSDLHPPPSLPPPFSTVYPTP